MALCLPRIFTISNSLTLGGNTFIKTYANADICDEVVGLSSVSFGGALTISNVSGTITIESFQDLRVSQLLGSVSQIVPASPGADLAWNTNTLATDGTLRVVSTTPPPIIFLASGNSLTVSWPVDHRGWQLQLQTNSLMVGIGTNWLDVAGSTATNQMTIPIDPDAPCTFYRLATRDVSGKHLTRLKSLLRYRLLFLILLHMNPAAIEAHLKLVLFEWMIIIAVAWIFGRLGKKLLGQPLAVGEIFAGLLLGPSALGLVWPRIGHHCFQRNATVVAVARQDRRHFSAVPNRDGI